jgi:hypothetical protein
LVSEFEAEEQATTYVAWVKSNVQVSLEDPRPGIPHDQVMAEMEAIIIEADTRHAGSRGAPQLHRLLRGHGVRH